VDTSLGSRMAMHNSNRLKIGLFGANCFSGRAVTLAPERWTADWAGNLALARMADDAGIDFLLPIARWKSYGMKGDYQGAAWETITWATGLLAATKNITVFGTVHAPLFHPIMAAKQMVTADHVGGGRFGLNLVVGWNEGEFDMFGVRQRDHEDRYDFAREWLDIVKELWSPRDKFDFTGRYFDLKAIRALPKPVGGERPVIMNAGASATGRTFAIRNCDALFTNALGLTFEQQTDVVRTAQSEARAGGRDLDVYTVGNVICRPTQREAEAYYQHAIIDNADWASVDDMLAARRVTSDKMTADEFQRARLMQANGMGGLPLIGTPDRVTELLSDLARAGLRGIALSFVNYVDELPYFCAEVLPRLRAQGLRSA
jgi:dimethylsulfone monooxygenase